MRYADFIFNVIIKVGACAVSLHVQIRYKDFIFNTITEVGACPTSSFSWSWLSRHCHSECEEDGDCPGFLKCCYSDPFNCNRRCQVPEPPNTCQTQVNRRRYTDVYMRVCVWFYVLCVTERGGAQE